MKIDGRAYGNHRPGGRKTMPCLRGRPHRGDPCERCPDDFGREVRCSYWDCGTDRDGVLERWIDTNPGYEAWKEGRLKRERVETYGTCAYCIEAEERRDQHREDMLDKLFEDFRYHLLSERRERERELRWAEQNALTEARREIREEKQRQRRALGEGRRTLTAIRRHLQGVDRLQPPVSRPARTSPTS